MSVSRADALALIARPIAPRASDTLLRIAAMAGVPGTGMRVGASVLQTPGAIQDELAQIDGDILAFGKELHDKITNAPGFPHTPETSPEQFFGSVWSPFVQNWQAWYANSKSWWGNLWWNHAPEAEQFRKQLLQLRDQAKHVGIDVQTPEPAKPPLGLVESVGNAVWETVKILLWVAGGAVIFGLLIHFVKGL